MSGDPYGESAVIDFRPRCWRCEKLLAEYAARPWRCKCVRCKANNQAGDVPPGAPEASDPTQGASSTVSKSAGTVGSTTS